MVYSDIVIGTPYVYKGTYKQGRSAYLLLEDSEGFKYTPQLGSFRRHKKCVLQPTVHNLELVCSIAGVTFLATFKDRGHRVTYESNGIIYTKSISRLRKEGHKDRVSYTTIDCIRVSEELNLPIKFGERKTLSYTCVKGHYVPKITWRDFALKTSNTCTKCHQDGLKYHKGTIHNYENVAGTLYVITLTNGTESFQKVGITTNIAKRFSRDTTYSISGIVTYPMNLVDAYVLEQQVLAMYKDYKYSPLLKFSGHTECLLVSTSELSWFIEKELSKC